LNEVKSAKQKTRIAIEDQRS